MLIFADDVKRVDDPRQEAKYSQQDVDGQIFVASALEENSQRRKNQCKDELEDVCAGKRHIDSLLLCW